MRHATSILRRLRDARLVLAELQQPGYGRLRISASTYSCYLILPHVLREFRVGYPYLEILVAADYTQTAIQHLLNGELDLAIFVLPPSTDGLYAETLCEDELVVRACKRNQLCLQTSAFVIYKH